MEESEVALAAAVLGVQEVTLAVDQGLSAVRLEAHCRAACLGLVQARTV